MPQMWHLFEGGFCLKVGCWKHYFFPHQSNRIEFDFFRGYLLTCSKCGAYLSKYGILTSWGKDFGLTNRFWICKNYWTYMWVGEPLVEGSKVCYLWKICFFTKLKKGIPLCLKHWFQSHVFYLNQAINKISLLCLLCCFYWCQFVQS